MLAVDLIYLCRGLSYERGVNKLEIFGVSRFLNFSQVVELDDAV
jgi:hypothetical protein